MRNPSFVIKAGLLFALIGAFFSGTLRAESITVSAAVSMREALTDAAKAYESESGDHVDFTFGASGQLSAQILNGAPVDAFISAANKQVDDLAKAGVIEDGSRRVVAGNDLVLIVPADATNPPAGFAQLADDSVKKVAIGEPKTVPAGQYAMEVLHNYKLADSIASRLVFGSNVRQVLDYVERGEVTAGIVYATDATEAGAKVKVIAKADAGTHEPIVYPAVIIKNSSKKAAAGKFLDYLTSGKGREFLAARGFTTTTAASATTAPGQ